MFRYIAFSWNPSSEEQTAAADRLDQVASATPDWRPALGLRNLRVYVAGNSRGVNDIYVLPQDQGVVLGRLFRRRCALLSEEVDIELSEFEAQRIVHSDGQFLVDDFWGRYIAFLPSWTGEPRVLRDPTSTLPCFRIEAQGLTVMFSRLEDVLALLEQPTPPVSWDAVAAYLLLGSLDGRETALAGISQLLGGELTSMMPSGGPPLTLWNAIHIASRAEALDRAEASQKLREATARCVQSWAACYPSILLRLSGGVDSSILLGTLCTGVASDRITCLNYHSPGSDSDERAFARLAAQRANTVLAERSLDDRFRLEDLLNAVRTPCPASYIGGMGSRNMDVEVAAAHGSNVIFTGADGDQIFYEVHRTWPAADYLFDRGIDRGFFKAALDAAHLGRVSFWTALRRAVAARWFRGRPADGVENYLQLLTPAARYQAAQAAHRFMHPGFLDATHLPIGKFHQASGLSSPLDYHNPYRNPASPDVVHPLRSQPLLEVSLRTPTYILTEGGQGRALARRTFADVLPPAIATRRSKGGMEAYAVTVLQRNLAFARELLMDGLLVKHGLLDRGRVAEALADRPAVNAAYVSETHACIATELWARRMTSR